MKIAQQNIMDKLNSESWSSDGTKTTALRVFLFFCIFSYKELRKGNQGRWGEIEGNTILMKMNNFRMSESSLYLLLVDGITSSEQLILFLSHSASSL